MLLRTWLVVVGLVTAGIGLAHLLFGARAIIGAGPVDATVDSELRFHAVLFIAFGWGFIWAAADPDNRAWLVNALGLAFLLGGLARLIAMVQTGLPHYFYVWMIPVEILIPVVNWLLLKRRAPTG